MLDSGDGLNSSQFSRHGVAGQEFSATEREANSTASDGAVTGAMVGEVSTTSEDVGGFESAGPVVCTALDSPAPFEVINCRIT